MARKAARVKSIGAGVARAWRGARTRATGARGGVAWRGDNGAGDGAGAGAGSWRVALARGALAAPSAGARAGVNK